MKSETYNEFEAAAIAGARALKEVLEERDVDDQHMALARMGSSAMASFAKLYQANSAREATIVSIITHASPDSDEFRRLVTAALPGTPVATALDAPKEAKPSHAKRSPA